MVDWLVDKMADMTAAHSVESMVVKMETLMAGLKVVRKVG